MSLKIGQNGYFARSEFEYGTIAPSAGEKFFFSWGSNFRTEFSLSTEYFLLNNFYPSTSAEISLRAVQKYPKSQKATTTPLNVKAVKGVVIENVCTILNFWD